MRGNVHQRDSPIDTDTGRPFLAILECTVSTPQEVPALSEDVLESCLGRPWLDFSPTPHQQSFDIRYQARSLRGSPERALERNTR